MFNVPRWRGKHFGNNKGTIGGGLELLLHKCATQGTMIVAQKPAQ